MKKVRDIMSKNLLTVHPKDKIQTAKALMEDFNIRHLPVEVMNKLAGIISLGDLLFISEKPIMHSFDVFIRDQKLKLGTIDEIMTSTVHTVQEEDSIDNLLNIMLEEKVNAVPVLANDQLVGLVTTYDLIKYLRDEI